MTAQPEASTRIRFRRILPIYVLFLLALLLALEMSARFLVAQSANPAIHLIVRDHARRAGGDQARFEGAPYVNYRLAAGFTEDLGPGRQTRHNAQGFRDNKDYGSKQPDVLRVICVGGSTTYGAGVRDNSETFPGQLERMLNEEPAAGGKRVEVFNMGVGGYTSAEVVSLLHFQALPLKPDVVLIHCAINDVAPRFYDDFRCDYTHFRSVWHDPAPGWARRQLNRSHFVLWAGWKLGWIEPLTLQSRTQRPLPPAGTALANLKINGPQCFRANLEAAITLAESSGADVWLLTQPYLEDKRFTLPTAEARLLEVGYQQGLREHNDVVRQVGRDRSVPVVDLDQALPRRLEYFSDPIHMTVEGNRVIATLIAQDLARSQRRRFEP